MYAPPRISYIFRFAEISRRKLSKFLLEYFGGAPPRNSLRTSDNFRCGMRNFLYLGKDLGNSRGRQGLTQQATSNYQQAVKLASFPLEASR